MLDARAQIRDDGEVDLPLADDEMFRRAAGLVEALAGIPSRRRARPEAGQVQGSRWSTRRLNDLDPCTWAATSLAPTGWDTCVT